MKDNGVVVSYIHCLSTFVCGWPLRQNIASL